MAEGADGLIFLVSGVLFWDSFAAGTLASVGSALLLLSSLVRKSTNAVRRFSWAGLCCASAEMREFLKLPLKVRYHSGSEYPISSCVMVTSFSSSNSSRMHLKITLQSNEGQAVSRSSLVVGRGGNTLSVFIIVNKIIGFMYHPFSATQSGPRVLSVKIVSVFSVKG